MIVFRVPSTDSRLNRSLALALLDTPRLTILSIRDLERPESSTAVGRMRLRAVRDSSTSLWNLPRGKLNLSRLDGDSPSGVAPPEMVPLGLVRGNGTAESSSSSPVSPKLRGTYIALRFPPLGFVLCRRSITLGGGGTPSGLVSRRREISLGTKTGLS